MQGFLYKPPGDGPFASIVLLPRCDGFTPFIRTRLPETLAAWGYAVLAVDGLSSRPVSDPCNDTRVDTLADAYGALRYLASQPFVDKQRVGVLGIASGGRVALTVADPQVEDVIVNDDKLAFRSIVAFYPQCGGGGDTVSTPALIMIGREDQWARPASCQEYARAGGGKRPIEIVLFPGVQHGFLEPEYMAGFDQHAAETALGATRDFLGRTLAPEQK